MSILLLRPTIHSIDRCWVRVRVSFSCIARQFPNLKVDYFYHEHHMILTSICLIMPREVVRLWNGCERVGVQREFTPLAVRIITHKSHKCIIVHVSFVGYSVGWSISRTHNDPGVWFSPWSPERLVEAWQEVGLDLRPRASGGCNFCTQPLHFELMSEKERSYFQGLSHVISATA
jgi:hypothetical protein